MSDKVTVTLEEFAKLDGIPGRDTLRRLIKENEDFPAKTGSNGVAYEIDLAAGIEWFRAREARREAELAERAEAARQLALDMLGEAAATDIDRGKSSSERKKLLEEEFYAIKVGEKRRELIRKDSIEAAIADVIAKDVRARSTFMARLGKRVELTRDQIAAGEAMIAADSRAFADALERLTSEGGDD